MNSLVKQNTNVVEANAFIGGNNVAITTQSTKALAEIQGKVVMAKQFPRDMNVVMARIRASCERKSLAESAEYQYPKGGTLVKGASIKLLESVAQCYGNIHYTWKEISRDMSVHRSVCVADAWDLENNVSSTLEFEVSHYRDGKGSKTLIASERDLYEHIASQAARRVRKCLENVIPRDLVDQARDWCDETLSSDINYQEGIDKAIDYFKDSYKINIKQIEKYFGMSRQGFNKNTYLSLKKLANSFKDGLSNPNEIFPPEEQKIKKQSPILKENTETKINEVSEYDGEF